ncbi:CHAT domain-containing protein, partial [Geitlerinema sp. P-1104]|uniref:CHAT domain-containing protein n=1 Tax=Geitlerinema sp. P-1104 TaxID=2546230 RepID=UPI0014769ADE
GRWGSQLNQARALEALGLYRRSCDQLLDVLTSGALSCDGLAADDPDVRTRQREELLGAIEQQPDSPLKAMALRSLGNQLRLLGQLELSDSILRQGLAVAERVESPRDIALSLLNLGHTYQALSQQALNYNRSEMKIKSSNWAAINYYRQASNSSSDPSVTVQAQLSLIGMWVESQREAEAVALFPEVRDRLSALPVGKLAIQGRIQLACSLLGCDRIGAQDEQPRIGLDQAMLRELLETSVQQAEGFGEPRLTAVAIGRLGTFYEATGDWERARELTEEAIALSEEQPDLVYQWQWQLGRILQARHEQTAVQEADAGAILAYEKAYTSLNGLRGDLASFDSSVQFNFRDRVEPVYRQFIDLLLRGDSPSQAHLKQARQAVEDLQLAELDNFFQDACVERQRVAADDLDPEAAILHTVVLKDRLSVIASFPGRQDLKYISNPGVTPTRLSTLIEDIREELDLPGGRTFKIRDLSEELYQWMISPLAEDLKLQEDREISTVKNLVFILDGLLQNLPMSVLYDHNRQQYLIERYAMAIVPGLQLVQSQDKPRVREDLRVLLAGTNEAPSFEAEELDNLNYVLTEVEGIGLMARRSTRLTEQRFLQGNVEAQVTAIPYDIVHLATHGKFSSDPNNTFLLDYNERIQVQNLDRLLRRSERVGLNAIELLTLSACQTATGDNRAALGLAGVAIRAGSRSTLASLWNVSDVSTALLMQEFYRLLLQTDLTKAEALREAQLKFINAELEVSVQASLTQNSLPRPHYWAPFILIGDWL